MKEATVTASPKYPNVEVQLSGEDGNAFFIIGRTADALERGGVSADEVQKYKDEARSRDYAHVIATTSDWVTVA